MRSKITAIVALLLIVHCQSIQDFLTPQPEPSKFQVLDPASRTGCAEVRGQAWFKCMEELSMKWEKIESADPKTRVIEKTRDGDWMVMVKEVCWSEYFCRYYIDQEYDPKVTSILVRQVLPVLLAAGIGYGVGYAALGPEGAAQLLLLLP